MQLYVFDQERRQLVGIIEAFDYFRWTRRYSQSGSFELRAIATEDNITLLQVGNILWKNDDEEAGLIEFAELTMQEQEFIVVSGRFATSFLARRIIWGTEILTGDLAGAVNQLLQNHLINPADPERKIDGITLMPEVLGVSVNTQVSYRNLLDTVSGLCETADIGIKTVFNPDTGVFTVKLYQGTETQAVFSKEYENIIEQVFTQSLVDYASIALVGGEGEGPERILATTGGGIGEERYEIFVDARDLQSEDFPDDYDAALIFRGQERLAELAMVKSFDVSVNQYGNLQYKIDFDIGSQVRIVAKRWGLSITARITEIEENYDQDGLSLSVVFGKPLLTLAQKLKGGNI
ncbi:MAG: siphovirus ReqiPepy6 Gp37-like family protein [Clostridiales bacterium]|nr:siphovirus ReqiPepy6 Gp37-like family protein [Clostridiales bacterium]